MTEAMPARNKDWMAKSRMLVNNIRCTTMSSCTTSMSAAISVISWEPSCVKEVFIKLLKQKRGKQGQRREDESRAEQVRDPEQAQLRVGGFDQHDRAGKQQ